MFAKERSRDSRLVIVAPVPVRVPLLLASIRLLLLSMLRIVVLVVIALVVLVVVI